MDDNAVGLWSREYSNKGLPSSFRDLPSEAVKYFVDFIRKLGVGGGTAVDIGCGTGRNSLYLARCGFDVYSIDMVPEMVDKLRRKSEEQKLSGRLHPMCASVTDRWQLGDGIVDMAVDTFCYTHQMTGRDKDFYREELGRVMRRGGFYLLTLPGVDDGYYKMFLKPQSKAIVDPVNSIPMILYEKEDVEAEFGGAFELLDYMHKPHRNMMHGKEYDRSTHQFIFRKR